MNNEEIIEFMLYLNRLWSYLYMRRIPMGTVKGDDSKITWDSKAMENWR